MLIDFVNREATTEIYTYRNTLSLHDALPIWGARMTAEIANGVAAPAAAPAAKAGRVVGIDVARGLLMAYVVIIIHGAFWLRLIPQVQARSEEHTSELQSLMRISYAVLCLKKKNRNNNSLDSSN